MDVACHGVEHALFDQPSQAQTRQVSDRLGLHGKPYIGYLGTLEPRKNVPALINGWADAAADLSEPPALVLAGGRAWTEEAAQAVANPPPPPPPGRPAPPPLRTPPALPPGPR